MNDSEIGGKPAASEQEPTTRQPDGEEAAATSPGGRPSLFERGRAALFKPRAAKPSAPPPPPPRKKKRRDGTLSAMSGFLSFILVALVAGVFGLISARHVLNEPGPLHADKVVYLPPRSDAPEMIAQLEREGVIDNPTLMNISLLVSGRIGALKPGEYLFKQSVSMQEVIDELIAGRQLLHAITIPEGLTSEQILQRLRDSEVLAGDVMDTPKEGALLPETYKVARGYPRSKLIAKMQEDQRKLVDQIWARRSRDLPFRTPYELVTLASIVEKETGKAEERPHVAAVFVNRLRKGMRLQSDPTIVYGLVGGKATLGRGITRSEIDKYTPYNTYAVDGLPPGPIANPGRAALEAAANPAHSADLYFVADGTGGHVFAETLDQHNRNVVRWRQIERDTKEKPAPDVDRLTPGAAPPAPRDQHGRAGPSGRLIQLGERHEDYPPAGRMAEDDGPTHRLGKFGPEAGLMAIESFDDPSFGAAPSSRAVRPARPFFSLAEAQPRSLSTFDPVAVAAAAAASARPGDGGDIDVAPEGPDGKPVADAGPEVTSYPVSARARAEQKARAARLGLTAGSDDLPDGVVGARDAAAEAPAQMLAAASAVEGPGGQQPRRYRAIDASEGTALDPLRDRSWDLSSAKVVPASASLR
ncbi:endolytic transglycosylase MltG [Methylocystis heyeri]|uniref:Endolytic murein transglycosylase n=1 Tax=Methylocystis heyeri TaxID=391905 RepID=A0A6B8KLM2_9HYPH|nr:endolytic transglycosylase MltG [Methylocystis heyeri]QGM47603.1 endolytic transglycosylase MltG [Methylocystis heyeri]